MEQFVDKLLHAGHLVEDADNEAKMMEKYQTRLQF